VRLASLIVLLAVVLIFIFGVEGVFVFYLLFEFRLIPIALIILGWGLQPERLRASLYMLFYTIRSSLPFLVVLLSSGLPTFNDLELTTVASATNSLIRAVLLRPFLVKTPMFLVHLWLPKAHVEAPVYGSIVLAGLLLKIGGYGI
jgi:NADH-ubiquinone oxidoreductase chain 4